MTRTTGTGFAPRTVGFMNMADQRSGEAFELGEKLTVLGRKLQPGQAAPRFELDHFDGKGISTVRLSDTHGRVRLLSVVNSLDTPVCDAQTRRWADPETVVPPGVILYTVSMDLPFAQTRWMEAAGAGHVALSAHRSKDFGIAYGVLIKEWRMLQRALLVICRDERVLHAEYVADQMQEPDYAAALGAVREAAST